MALLVQPAADTPESQPPKCGRTRGPGSDGSCWAGAHGAPARRRQRLRGALPSPTARLPCPWQGLLRASAPRGDRPHRGGCQSGPCCFDQGVPGAQGAEQGRQIAVDWACPVKQGAGEGHASPGGGATMRHAARTRGPKPFTGSPRRGVGVGGDRAGRVVVMVNADRREAGETKTNQRIAYRY